MTTIVIFIVAFIFGSESKAHRVIENLAKAAKGENWIDFTTRINKLDAESRDIAYKAYAVKDSMRSRGIGWNEAVNWCIADIQERAKGSNWAGNEEKLCNQYKSLYI